MKIIKRFLAKLGPGLITGASDDDPAGVIIYAQAGAATGTALSWTAIFTLPFMVTIQEMCARIGLVTGHGLVGTMKKYYPKIILITIAMAVTAANTINIGADIAGIATSAGLFLPFHPLFIAFFVSCVIISFMLFFPYRILVNIFKWLTFTLLAYIATGLIVVGDWREVLLDTFIPHIALSREQILILVAIFGTTISPYLFFWQASEEAEEKKEGLIRKTVTKNELRVMREDVATGMLLSNLVMYFIIVTSAKTLGLGGITEVESAQQAASTLSPLAGEFASILFTLGIVGTGMLAIPVLAGSAAYAVSEVFGWREGLSLPWSKARAFYSIIIFSTFLGFLLTALGPALGVPPFRALFLTGIIYGFLSPLLILAILHIANNKQILGDKVNGMVSNILGVATFVLMTFAVFAIFLS